MAQEQEYWTSWYNTDRPWVGRGDDETVTRIQNLYGPVCRSGYRLDSAQCRDEVGDFLFDTATPHNAHDALKEACTIQGLECVNTQQAQVNGRTKCSDYSIRFHCRYAGSDDSNDGFFPQFDVRIYIILAVVPILIFLIRILWAYVFRKRRQRRRNERRAARLRRLRGSVSDGGEDDTSSINSALAQPPPSYHELFPDPNSVNGGRSGSVFLISRGNLPVCSACQSSPCSVAIALNNNNNNNNNTPAGSSSPPPSVGNNPGVLQTSGDVSMQEAPGWASNSSRREEEVAARSGQPAPSLGSAQGTSGRVESSTGHDSVIDDQLVAENSPVSGPGQNLELSRTNTCDGARQGNGGEDIRSQQTLTVENEVNDSTSSVEISNSSDVSETGTHATQGSPNPTPLVSSLSMSLHSISQPCACACHRTVSLVGRGEAGFDNEAFTLEEETVQRSQFLGMHAPVPGLHRVWSNLSATSTITLSELPSYEDALELIKKKEAEAL